MDKPPKRSGDSHDAFPAVTPNERESIMRNMKAMEDRMTKAVFSTVGEIRSDVDNLQQQVIELRVNAVQNQELRQEVRGLRDDIRAHSKALTDIHTNDVQVERILGAVRAELAGQAKEAGAAAGTEAGVMAARKGKGRQALISTVVAGIVSGAFVGLGKGCEHTRAAEAKPERVVPVLNSGPK